MAKSVKQKPEETLNETVETNDNVVLPESSDTPEVTNEETFIPDIPAQMEPLETSLVTESEFLQRILNIQHTGGFGRHLDEIIYDRLKTLK